MLAGACLLLSLPGASYGDDLRGRVDVSGVSYPNLSRIEGRMRLFGLYEARADDRWVLVASACADLVIGDATRETFGIVRPLETYLQHRSEHVEIRLGLSNVVWGVLDEISPQDVINPIDVSRFVLESRAEARLPVPLARIRLFLPAGLSVEALVVPFARRGTFDQLDEVHSPFAPAGLGALPRSDLQTTWENVEGGVRLRGTNSGVDWGASVYRDVVDFDRYELSLTGLTAFRPRRWVVGGDVEAARGNWVFRGEGALSIDDPLQADRAPVIVTRSTFQGGVGVDRRVGENTVFLNALYQFIPKDPLLATDSEISLVGGVARDFLRDTQHLRLFGAWNTSAGSAFGRATWTVQIVETLHAEIGAGVFHGEGGTILGRLADSDFVAARLRVSF